MTVPSVSAQSTTATGVQTAHNAERARSEALTAAARDFETAFLAEALKHIGLDASRGVSGSEHFSSFLNRAYAEKLVERGGLGLSEHIVRALAAREEGS